MEIKGGADVVSRAVDEAAKLTRFELLPREGDTSLVMTLNSHLQRQQRAVVARSVLVDEVTQAYEKLHATVSLEILYRAVDQFRFVVPEGFEITEVDSPLLARWDVQARGRPQAAGRAAARADHRDGGAEASRRSARPAGSTTGTPRGWSRWTWSAAWPCSACWSRTG